MKRTFIAIVALLLPVALFGQQQESAIILYLDDPAEVEIFDDNDFAVENPDIGTEINPGDRIVTGNTSAEIQFLQNGSIVHLKENTDLRLQSLQGRDGGSETRIDIGSGRMRMVAARLSGREYRYAVRTPGAVAGVRGTDFGVSVLVDEAGAAVEELFVLSGEVLFEAVDTGEQIFVGAGQKADVFAETFLPVDMTQEEIGALRQDFLFREATPATVPGNEPEPEPEPEPEVNVEAVEIPTEEPQEEPEPGFGDRLFGNLAQITGLQVGSVTLNGETYSQAIFQPRLSAGKLALGLYLPITYTSSLFDPSDWYRPEGNDEWSFGSDQDWNNEPAEALADVATDIALKVKYLEYGTREDPFFLKVGNLDNFTLGQGLLMENYANDVDFPVVRRIGFNMGMDRRSWGFEAMANDLIDPQLVGGRMYFRPVVEVLPVAIGITGITDRSPGDNIALTDRDGNAITANQKVDETDPAFINVGADISIPVVRREILSLTGYAEAGGMMPYLRNDGSDQGVSAGLETDALVNLNTGEIRNFGWIAGFRGNALILDYRLEFRSFDGTFRPAFYDSSYDRLRATYAAETIAYLANPDAEEYQQTTMGVFGQAGANLFDLVGFSLGYFWPWVRTDAGSLEASSNDELVANLYLQDGLIPYGITAGLEYRRTFFAATVGGWGSYEEATLFDANTTLDGYVSYPLTEQIKLVARVSTAVKRDEEGVIVYDRFGRPVITPVVAVQTEIGL